MTCAIRFIAALVLFTSSLGLAAISEPSHAAGAPAGAAVPGLALRVAPIVDVGTRPTFSLYARSWPSSGRATLRYLSPNHGFTGSMLWDVTCRCFRLAVALGRRVHPLERAHAWATVRFAHGTATATATFAIRGLAPDRRRYAPGGTPHLNSWVGDPRPAQGMTQHFCAWLHATDAYGFSGVRVRFVVGYLPTPQQLAAQTNANGLACARGAVSSGQVGVVVKVNVYAGKLHGVATFTPRA